MSAPRLRRRVEVGVFTRWRQALPGLALPPWLDGGDPGGDPAGDPGGDPGGDGGLPAGRAPGTTVPPMVAAALALQADPWAAVRFELREPGGVTRVCVAVDGDAACGLACRAAGDGAWVEVALVPVERAVEEVLRWVPARPVSPVTLVVWVAGPVDAVVRPLGRWTASAGEGWLPDPVWDTGDLATLPDDLRAALAGCLAAAAPVAPVARDAR